MACGNRINPVNDGDRNERDHGADDCSYLVREWSAIAFFARVVIQQVLDFIPIMSGNRFEKQVIIFPTLYPIT
jgi:hypothetical protein